MADSHVELPDSRRPRKPGAHKLRDVDPNTHIELTLNLRGPALPQASAVGEKTLAPADFEKRFGASPEDVQVVEQALRPYGLTVEDVNLAGRSVRVSGTAAAVESAFKPNLAVYHSPDQGNFRGREGTIQIPAELEGIVTGVFGLDQRKMAHRKKARAVRLHAHAPPQAHSPQTPADLEARYSFPANDAAGQTIAIAEFGEPLPTGGANVPPVYFPDDVTNFCARHHRVAPPIAIVPVNFAPLTRAQYLALPHAQRKVSLDASGEVMMDVEIVAALAPNANIVVYFASFDEKGWVDLLDMMTAAKPALPVALSVSWGAPEDSSDWSAGARKAIDQRLQAAAMLGITVCVASGDDGTGDGLDGARAHVDFPSSSPFVLAVGGTMLSHPYAAAGASEDAWFEPPGRRTTRGGGATGGGISTIFPRPPWQTVQVGSLNAGSIDGRVVPDVAALAGPPYYDIIFDGRSAPSGGTSASAPLWAALIARVNAALPQRKRQRFLTRLLYQPAARGQTLGQTICRDVVTGQNASHPSPGVGYAAAVGYDAVTGWGVPLGTAMVTALS